MSKNKTQIASTPVLKGNEALKVYEEANRGYSKKAESGFKILEKYFKKLIKERRKIKNGRIWENKRTCRTFNEMAGE